jgi:nucleotide-binding universal stress UspA family protein
MMAEPLSRKYRRVLLQIDMATHCHETVGAAIDITARLGGELQGIFIEDSDLLAVGELDFIHEFRLSSPTGHQLDRLTIEGQLRAMARSVQRQMERAASRRKITVGFRSIRGDIIRSGKEPFEDADLVIIESTGRLHRRSFRERVSGRSRVLAATRPTLLLKGGQKLAPYVTIICDSVEAADHGLQAVATLLITPLENITLLPYRVSEEDRETISKFVEKFSAISNKVSEGKSGVNLIPTIVENEAQLQSLLFPDDCVVVMKTGGAILSNPALLDPLIIGPHPLLFIQ